MKYSGLMWFNQFEKKKTCSRDYSLTQRGKRSSGISDFGRQVTSVFFSHGEQPTWRTNEVQTRQGSIWDHSLTVNWDSIKHACLNLYYKYSRDSKVLGNGIQYLRDLWLPISVLVFTKPISFLNISLTTYGTLTKLPCACMFSCIWPFATPWTVTCQAPLSMGLPRQEYWSRLSFPFPGDLPDPGIRPTSFTLAGGFFTTEPWEALGTPSQKVYSCASLFHACPKPDFIFLGHSLHKIKCVYVCVAVRTWGCKQRGGFYYLSRKGNLVKVYHTV